MRSGLAYRLRSGMEARRLTETHSTSRRETGSLNNACITAALIVLHSFSAASAEENDCEPDDSVQSLHSAIALHTHAHRLAHELEYHYRYTNWARHQGATMSHLAHQIEQDVSLGDGSRCRRKVQCLQKQLDHVELLMRRSIALHGRADGGHVPDSLRQMKDLAESLDRSLERLEVGRRDAISSARSARLSQP